MLLRILKECNIGRSGLSDRVDIVDLDSASTHKAQAAARVG